MLAMKPDFLLHTGDFVTAGGIYEQWGEQFFAPSAALLRVTTLFPCPGNHEKDKEEIAGFPSNYLKFFSVPSAPDANERHYSFEYSNALVVSLSHSLLGKESAEVRWLEETLKNSRQTWKFVYFHEPPYSPGGHGSNQQSRNLMPLFLRYGVDLVFNGHDHIYCRTRPLKDSMIAPDRAVTCVVTGGGGTTPGKIFVPNASFAAKAREGHHFCLVRVEEGKLSFQAVSADDGSVFDEFSFSKQGNVQDPEYVKSAMETRDVQEGCGSNRPARSATQTDPTN